jgi:HD superfamily phosphodiesterase
LTDFLFLRYVVIRVLMLLKQQPFHASLEAFYPGLIERVRSVIDEAEKKFAIQEDGPNGFLWEHTLLVTAQSFRLAKKEKVDADLAAITALFHDSGKFSEGRYHVNDKPEEEEAARLARIVLGEFGLSKAKIGQVVRALRALYRSGARRNHLSDIVHDADFLSKFGYLGVANFFVKMALRGRNLESTVINSFSKELTYAAVLPANMRTATARRIAKKKSAETLSFYRSCLAELEKDYGIAFRVRKVEVRRPGPRGIRTSVLLVLTDNCGGCGGKWAPEIFTEQGLKCERLKVVLNCAACGEKRSTSFCLPELG